MTARLPSLESLRVFEVCARHGNFTRAASELGVTTTAVSLRVRNLEAELGTRLFVRFGPRVTLTDAGGELANRMTEIVGAIRAAVAQVQPAESPIRLTTTPTFAARCLAPRLSDYRANAIRLTVSSATEPLGTFDLAIRSGRGPWPGLEAIATWPLEATPMLSPALAASVKLERPEDLLLLLLLRDEDWPRWFQAAGVDGSSASYGTLRLPSQELAAEAAAAGAGVALLSPVLFQAMVMEGRLIRPFVTESRRAEAYWLLRREAETRASVLHLAEWLARTLSDPVCQPVSGSA